MHAAVAAVARVAVAVLAVGRDIARADVDTDPQCAARAGGGADDVSSRAHAHHVHVNAHARARARRHGRAHGRVHAHVHGHARDHDAHHTGEGGDANRRFSVRVVVVVVVAVAEAAGSRIPSHAGPARVVADTCAAVVATARIVTPPVAVVTVAMMVRRSNPLQKPTGERADAAVFHNMRVRE
jgi:hypothetical protein